MWLRALLNSRSLLIPWWNLREPLCLSSQSGSESFHTSWEAPRYPPRSIFNPTPVFTKLRWLSPTIVQGDSRAGSYGDASGVIAANTLASEKQPQSNIGIHKALKTHTTGSDIILNQETKYLMTVTNYSTTGEWSGWLWGCIRSNRGQYTLH